MPFTSCRNIVSILFVSLLLSTVYAARSKPSNECAAVDLSLSITVVELYATINRISVGEVILSITDGNLVTSISLVEGCTLVDEIQVDIFPGSTLEDVIPGRFPCKQPGSGSSLTLTCPVTGFNNIEDCCAKDFLIAVHAVVSCTGIDDVGEQETAFAAEDPSENRCTGRRGWCNFVPVTLEPACEPGCDDNIPFVEECQDNKCVKSSKTPCEDFCDGVNPIQSVCDPSSGSCDNTPKAPCVDRCNGNIPIMSTCNSGVCDEEELDPCQSRCNGNIPITSTCNSSACQEVSGNECTDECNSNILITRSCEAGSCTETQSTCGTCETCETTGTGDLMALMCVKTTCDEGERLNEQTCECCPVCGEDEFIAQNGCDCVSACDACPPGSLCANFIDGDGNVVVFCRDCSCGYCLNGDDCCRTNPQDNCVPNREDLPSSVQCQSSDYEPFPDSPNSDVCRGEEGLNEDIAMGFVNTCGCVPSREVACTFAPPDPSAKCFIKRKDGMELA